MSSLSKLLGQAGCRILTHNCYELGHTWTPSCSQAAVDILRSAFAFSLKVYSTLYVVTTLAKGPKLKDIDLKRLIADILRSTIFLTTNGMFFISCLCAIRKSMGLFVLPNLGFTNSFVASFLAILVERSHRRRMLALYLMNLASEVLFRMGLNRGFYKSIPKGQVLILASSMAAYFYMMKKKSLDKGVTKIFSLICGVNKDSEWINMTSAALPSTLVALLKKLRAFRVHSKPELCSHPHSCVSSVVEAFLRNFCIAFGLSSSLRLVTSLPSVIRNPFPVLKGLFNSKSMQLPLFVGCLPAFYRLSQCIIHKYWGVDNAATEALSGFFSGCAMFFYPSTSIAMYAVWKLIEILYFKASDKGYLPRYKHADIWLYTFSTSFVLFAAVMEPHSIRPAYWKFITDLTGGRYPLVYRRPLDVFGMHTSKLMPDFVPDLNPLYTTINPKLIGPP